MGGLVSWERASYSLDRFGLNIFFISKAFEGVSGRAARTRMSSENLIVIRRVSAIRRIDIRIFIHGSFPAHRLVKIVLLRDP